MTTAAVLLAAGGGSRFVGGAHKLLVEFRGRPLYEYALDAVIEAALDETIVVTGSAPLDLPDGLTVVANPRWAEGQATSVRTGLDAAERAGHDAVVIGLADQPLIPSEAWRLVAACDERPVAVATYDGRARQPGPAASARCGRSCRRRATRARVRLVRGRQDLVCAVACPGNPVDIDTVEDLRRWNS